MNKKNSSDQRFNARRAFACALALAMVLLINLAPAIAEDRLTVKGSDGVTDTFKVNDDGTVFTAVGIGVGIAAPTHPSSIQVQTTGKPALIYAERTDGATVQFSAGRTSTYFGSRSNHPMHLLVGQYEKVTIDTDGYMGIGTTAPAHPLHFGGQANNAYIAADGTYHSSCSREYKENIRELSVDKALDALAELAPVEYNYKKNLDETYVGFIAEDVPDLVAAKDRKTLVTMDIVGVLTKVVQEQQKTISELRERLEEVENQLKR